MRRWCCDINYDKGGNIAQKIEYAYTTEELGEPVSTINYTYDSVWKDKLTAYGDTQIQTDSMGNPLNYVGTGINGVDTSGTLEWNGRQLSAVTIGNERYEYSYNAEGMRTSVKVYSVSGELDKIYYYIWKNGKLNGFYIKDMNGTDDGSVKMLFDVDGEPIGYEVVESNVESEPQTFFFRRNLQGDIVAVCHKGGWDIITYAYDAWGGVQVLTMDNNFALCLFALICTPITYRGYNYDVFTGLYYLQSRYYNPTYGRFLNVDSIMKKGEPLGANIFAYCGNNPVNFVDYDGRDAMSVVTNILYLLVVVAVMDNDGLLERFDYIFEGATSFTFRLLKYDDEVMVLEAYFIHNIVNDFRIYTVSIDIIDINAVISAVDNLMFDYVENDVVDIVFGGLMGLFFEIPQEVEELSVFEDVPAKIQNYKIISFLRTKRDQALSSGEQYVVFVDMITMHYTTMFGNTKKKTIYSCYK